MWGSENWQWVGVVLLNVQLRDGDVVERGVSQGGLRVVETVDVLALIAAHEMEMARGDDTRPGVIPPPYRKQTG